ncbi:hypothetical protein ACP26L_36505 (plasmid) [Paenibacillus sp. S-38]|uniref:hypothetical protein n=1 Tax=Paenibacillus sp. S-38 TaxID=3416710 RepID=UPI003CF423D9
MASRASLNLPCQKYIELDDWEPKLGKAYIVWKKLQTMVNRKDRDRPYDKIDCSQNILAKRMGIGKVTFQKLVRLLWDYALIDLVDVKARDCSGTIQECTNIIVHKYPQNNPELAEKPLEKVRDFDTQRITAKRKAGALGGRPKHRKKEQYAGDLLEMAVDNSISKPSSDPEGGIQTKPPGGSEIEPNNSSNSLNPNYLKNKKPDDHARKRELTQDQIIENAYESCRDPVTGKMDLTDAEFDKIVKRVLDHEPRDLEAYLKAAIIRFYEDRERALRRRYFQQAAKDKKLTKGRPAASRKPHIPFIGENANEKTKNAPIGGRLTREERDELLRQDAQYRQARRHPGA